MISDDFLFLFGKDSALLLVSRDYHLNTLFQIFLSRAASAVPYSSQRRFIDYIGKLRAGGAYCRFRDFVKIHIIRNPDLFCVNFQDFFSSLKIRKLHRNPPVKSSRSQKSRVQRIRPIGRRQNHNAFGTVESIHLRQKLVQCLLPLIVSAGKLAVPLLADGVNFINKYNTRSLFRCLFE